MIAPLIKGASGLAGGKLTYASIDENNKERFCKHTFHSAFWDESAPENPIRRQSIEIRLLCAYEDDGDSNKSKL